MPHVIEPAASGRSKCRGCKRAIAGGELRFGECLPNPFADGDMTIWFHLRCGAMRRPAAFREVMAEAGFDVGEFEAAVAAGAALHRLERLCGAERAPSGRARCRSCREPIPKDSWRIALEFFEEGTFNAAGYIHAGCSSDYFGTAEITDRLRLFAPDLDEDAFGSLEADIQ